MQKINPCLWFNGKAEEAVNFYVANLKNSKIEKISRYGLAGYEIHGMKNARIYRFMTSSFQFAITYSREIARYKL